MTKTETEEVKMSPDYVDYHAVVAIRPAHEQVEIRGYIRRGDDADLFNRSEFRNNVIVVWEPSGFARFFGDTIEKRIRWAADEMRRRTFREIRKRLAHKEQEKRLQQAIEKVAQSKK